MAAQSENSYCGWSNYETYAMSHWLWRDCDRCGHVSTIFVDACDHETNGMKAERLRELVRAELDSSNKNSGIWSDLLLAGFKQINWIEIVENTV